MFQQKSFHVPNPFKGNDKTNRKTIEYVHLLNGGTYKKDNVYKTPNFC
jgi:hypothetical protein